MPSSNIKDFLQRIQQIESSGGTNLNHPVIQGGIHKGDKAIGRYALMPNTVRELVNRRKISGNNTAELDDLSQMDSSTMKQHIEQNPELEEQLAQDLAQRVMQRQGGDEDRAAYSWKQGHNLTPDSISDEQLDNNGEVQKYRKLKEIMQTPEEN